MIVEGTGTEDGSGTEVVAVATPVGPGRLFLDLATAPTAILVLGHGAGGGVDAADLLALAQRLPALGVSVVRFEQPWRTAGRKVAVAPPRLDEAWQAGVRWSAQQPWWLGPVVFGGRSAGARVACRTATDPQVAAVVCLAFPLHPPGRPDRSRVAELLAPRVPRLVLQGTNDAFGGADEVREALGDAGTLGDGGRVEIVALPGADHGFRLARAAAFRPADLQATVLAAVHAFVTRLG